MSAVCVYLNVALDYEMLNIYDEFIQFDQDHSCAFDVRMNMPSVHIAPLVFSDLTAVQDISSYLLLL